MKQAANAHYADRYHALLGLLANAPKDANPQELFETMRQEAIAAYQDLNAELASKIKVPKLVKLPDSDYTALKNELRVIKDENDSLKQHFAAISEVPERLRDNSITSTLAAEPDANRASNLLTHYIKAVAERVLPPHMALALHGIHASVRIAGRDHRIMIGDYLKRRAKPLAPSRRWRNALGSGSASSVAV
jgi:hypothetical protein